jgi:hypothetical protein
MLRDSLVYFPWYKGTRPGLRRVNADFGGVRLHDWTCEVMKQHESYGHFIAASLDQDLSTELPALRQPLMILRDLLHPFAVWHARADALLPAAVRADASMDAAALAATVWDFYRRERVA